MGFSLRKIFSKRGIRGGVLAMMGTPLAGIGTTFSDQASDTYEGIHKGIGNMITGGYLGQKEATEEAKKARDQASSQYAASQAAAEAEANRLANLEEERKRRLLLYGTQNPSTLMGTYTGLPGAANVGRSTLG